jgi:hypothetical protein
VLPPVARLSLEAVDLFDDLDWDEDLIFLEAQKGVGIVQEDVRIEDIILYQGLLAPPRAALRSPRLRPWRRIILRTPHARKRLFTRNISGRGLGAVPALDAGL